MNEEKALSKGQILLYEGNNGSIKLEVRLEGEYIIKGFALDDMRLKEPKGGRYFEELLARIRDIRSSEKVFWRKILDIYATSIDYDPQSEYSKLFFQQVQNKMHWATHGHTAAELIYQRADAEKPNMGITNYPGNKLLKRDVEIAKNYLSITLVSDTTVPCSIYLPKNTIR